MKREWVLSEIPRLHSNREEPKWITELPGFNCTWVLGYHVSKVNEIDESVSLENGQISERKENWSIFTRLGLGEENIDIISEPGLY